LVIMLTFMPAAVGLACVASTLHFVSNADVTYHVTFASWLFGAIGLGASVFHLGQPLRAWRIFLGWRKSWLSREAIALGLWITTATCALVVPELTPASAVLGLLGLGCSAMVYIDTRRVFWRAAQTVPRFFGTAAIVGAAVVAPMIAGMMLLAKMLWELRTFSSQTVSGRLQSGALSRVSAVREITGLLAVVLLVAWPGWLAATVLVAGELAERLLFFRAVDAPKMPGLPALASTRETS
jgi:formate dehydrogenase iron-sulfur subunit